jgi:hypothetical protein
MPPWYELRVDGAGQLSGGKSIGAFSSDPIPGRSYAVAGGASRSESEYGSNLGRSPTDRAASGSFGRRGVRGKTGNKSNPAFGLLLHHPVFNEVFRVLSVDVSEDVRPSAQEREYDFSTRWNRYLDSLAKALCSARLQVDSVNHGKQLLSKA